MGVGTKNLFIDKTMISPSCGLRRLHFLSWTFCIGMCTFFLNIPQSDAKSKLPAWQRVWTAKKCVVSVHTWFSDIRECIADWSQSKHILGLHFKVVPEWRQRKYLMKDSVIECHYAGNICDQMKVKRMLMTVADVRGSSAQVDLQKERLIPPPSQRYAQHNKRAIWPGFKGRVESEETFGY